MEGGIIDLTQAHSLHQAEHLEQTMFTPELHVPGGSFNSSTSDSRRKHGLVTVQELQEFELRLRDSLTKTLKELQRTVDEAINGFGDVTSKGFGQIEANESLVNEKILQLEERMSVFENGLMLIMAMLINDKATDTDKVRFKKVMLRYMQQLSGTPQTIVIDNEEPVANDNYMYETANKHQPQTTANT